MRRCPLAVRLADLVAVVVDVCRLPVAARGELWAYVEGYGDADQDVIDALTRGVPGPFAFPIAYRSIR